jgi:hypothetical protein
VKRCTPLLQHLRPRGITRVEPTPAARAARTERVYDRAQRLLLRQMDSWVTVINSNVPGKQARAFPLHAVGAPTYRAGRASGRILRVSSEIFRVSSAGVTPI